jgi:chemotaxis protein CheX
MDANQLDIFRRITLDYFAKLAPDAPPPTPAPAFIRFENPDFLDYASVVKIDGPLEGCLYITAPRATLDRLLALHGQKLMSEEVRLDMCRELSNVLSGNASKAFGSQWHISIPTSLTLSELPSLTLPAATFTMPVDWLGETFYIVVGLSEKPQ